MRDIAYFTIRPQLGTVPGAAPLPPEGGTDPADHRFSRSTQMQAHGVAVGDIVKAVNAENVLIPAGDVKIGDFDYNVFSNSMIRQVQDLNDDPHENCQRSADFLA